MADTDEPSDVRVNLAVALVTFLKHASVVVYVDCNDAARIAQAFHVIASCVKIHKSEQRDTTQAQRGAYTH